MGRLEIDPWHWVNLVGRTWWGAETTEVTKPLPHPISWIRFCYEDIMDEHLDITDALQDCQRQHMTVSRLTDISYNFLVDKDGTVYEGRGWNHEADRPFSYWGLDGKCLDICYIGDYELEETLLPWDQLRAGMNMIMYGLKMKYISAQYRTIGLRDTYVPPYSA